jgi:hypothetical protein
LDVQRQSDQPKGGERHAIQLLRVARLLGKHSATNQSLDEFKPKQSSFRSFQTPHSLAFNVPQLRSALGYSRELSNNKKGLQLPMCDFVTILFFASYLAKAYS